VLPDRSQDWVGCLTPPALSFLAALFLGHGFAFLLLVQAVTHFELLLLRANRKYFLNASMSCFQGITAWSRLRASL
jgi:hypothetical protein